MYRLNQVKLNIYHSDYDFKSKIAKLVKVSVDDIEWSTLIILHKSIDARDKKNILFVYNVAIDFVGVDIIRPLERYEPVSFNPIVGDDILPSHAETRDLTPKTVGADIIRPHIRPIVVGFGPAGIFASYIFALNGLKPIIIERGKSLDDRTKDVDKFFKTMELDEESNVCFGEGGAGAFSDGKLNTNNKDKTGIYHFVLETFVKFGADEKILYENMPHIGTDKLVDVIKNMRDEILRLGGEIHYNTKWTYEVGSQCLPLRDDLNKQSAGGWYPPLREADAPVVLAIGNSSRDTFRDLIENGFELKAKPFAIGYRIAHKQEMIDDAQYGAGSQCSPLQDKMNQQSESNKQRTTEYRSLREILGPATYKLTYDVGNGHSVYSFCMCPGGYIINSSNFKNMLSINGMSYNDRSGVYANSAIVETISPEDVLGSQRTPLQEEKKTQSELNQQGATECRPLHDELNKQSAGGWYPPLRDELNKQGTTQDDALKMIEFQEMIERRAFELEKGFIPYVTSGGRDICPEEVFKGKAKYSEKLREVFEGIGLSFNINEDIEKALQHFNKIISGFFSAGSQCSPLQDESPHYIIAGVETRTSSPVKLDRDENYMCNVPNYYPCGEGLGHGGGIMSCAVDGINTALKVIKNKCV